MKTGYAQPNGFMRRELNDPGEMRREPDGVVLTRRHAPKLVVEFPFFNMQGSVQEVRAGLEEYFTRIHLSKSATG